ncbi:TBC1 domain family member 5, partial [Plakobranchus ocellatus]
EQELQHQVSQLQGELHDKENMCRYCSSKLDVHIERLQQDLSRSEQHIEGEVMVSLAGLKLVRDILNGTLRFSQNITSDEDLAIIDGYYGNQSGAEAETHIGSEGYSKGTTSTASPDSDILLGVTSGSSVREKPGSSGLARDEAKLSYMSNEKITSTEENMSSGLTRQSSNEEYSSAKVLLENNGEMAEIASRPSKTADVNRPAALVSTNPFHDSLSSIYPSTNGEDKDLVSESVPSSSKIKNMFKINAADGENSNATLIYNTTNNNTKQHHRHNHHHHHHHHHHRQSKPLQSQTAVPSSIAASQLDPSFSLFESAPMSAAGHKDQPFLSGTHNKGRPGEVQELSSFDSRSQRSRAKSDVTGGSAYWPDFLSSNIRLPWYGDGAEGDSQSRERSQSHPAEPRGGSAASNGAHSGDGEKFDVNPLYRLRYSDNMEH